MNLRKTNLWYRLSNSPFLRGLISLPLLKDLFYFIFPPSNFLGIPIFLGPKGFFYKLKEKKVNYVVLRWFENLPSLKGISDIDILVEDIYFQEIRSNLTRFPLFSCISVDLSIMSAPQKLINYIPYYPHNLAEQILKNSYYLKGYIKVPNTKLYFWSLAYHTLYHKGFKSNIDSKYNGMYDNFNFNSKYLKQLEKLSKLDSELPAILPNTTLENIHQILGVVNWVPTLDTLYKLKEKNEWIASYLADEESNMLSSVNDKLVVFFVRESNSHQVERIEKFIIEAGLTKPLTIKLNPEEIKIATKSVRGNSWPVNDGGPPSHLIITSLQNAIRKPYIEVVGSLKKKIRTDNILRSAGKKFGFSNVVHSSDSGILAYHYISIIKPSVLKSIISF